MVSLVKKVPDNFADKPQWKRTFIIILEAEFKEFEPRLKYGWFHLNSYQIFQDSNRFQLKPVFGGFETWFILIKFGLYSDKVYRCESEMPLYR